MPRSHTLQIPLDQRAMCGALWVAAFVLALIDSADDQLGVLALWAAMLGLVGAAWTTGLLLAHTRRVMLDVMSFEHRQQTPQMDGPMRPQAVAPLN